MRLKKQWLREMLLKYGSVAKIAYFNDKPVAQILFYSDTADTTKACRSEGVLHVACIYNPTPEAQKLGIGTKLLQAVIQDVKQRRSCLGSKPCKFISTKAFNTGAFFPLSDFFRKNGFVPTSEGQMLYLPVEGTYERTLGVGTYEALSEDKNRAIVFYGPSCQFSYPFAKKIEHLIKETAPNIRIELVNEWEKPEESIKRHNWWLIVNAKPIHTFFMETEKFRQEIKQAVSQNF